MRGTCLHWMVRTPEPRVGFGPPSQGVAVSHAKPSKHVPQAKRIVFAHRGSNRLAPENTMPAFELAVVGGATWIETDVDITGDGAPVIIHDSTLDRTTNRTGLLVDLDSSELDTVDAGAWFSPAYEGVRLPRLAEVIDFINDRAINANIELKSHESGEAGTNQLIDVVIKELARLDPEREIIISSFSPLVLDRFHQRAPEYTIAMLWTKETLGPDWLSVLEMVGATYAHLENEGLTEAMVKAITSAGYGVSVWTVNDRARANELFSWGCTGIFSDVATHMLDFQQV